MSNKDYIYSEISKLYDIYKENPKLVVKCNVVTNNLSYNGILVFDDNFVVSNESILLKDIITFNNSDEQIAKYEYSVISLKDISVFSYKVIE